MCCGPPEEGLAYLWGGACRRIVTAREHQTFVPKWPAGISAVSFAPCTRPYGPNRSNLALRCPVNRRCSVDMIGTIGERVGRFDLPGLQLGGLNNRIDKRRIPRLESNRSRPHRRGGRRSRPAADPPGAEQERDRQRSRASDPDEIQHFGPQRRRRRHRGRGIERSQQAGDRGQGQDAPASLPSRL